MKKRFVFSLAALLIAAAWARPAAADDTTYAAEFSDGQRVAGGHLSDWGNSDQPKINGRPLHDQASPIRWLRRETTEQPALPAAYVEMVGGDVLPGRTIGLGASPTLQEGDLGSFLVVEPTSPVNRPDGPPRATVRVMTRWLRRVVWQRRANDQYEPSTLYFRDGRQMAFRSLRFRESGVAVLTENGRQDIPFTDLAELHMPRADWWNSYFEQVALLTPDCKLRLLRLQTLDGLRATVSPDRVQVIPWGDQNNQEFWYQAVQPAWSMDAFFLRHARILLRQYFGPHEVPLSLIEPLQTRLRSALAVGWPPRMDSNVQGGPLISGGKEYGWGLGTQAYSEIDFPLPSCAVSFRSTVGLDRVVGTGGCARAIVYANKAEGQPLYRSDHLIGAEKIFDTGVLPLNAAQPNAQLVIVSHPDSSDRPAGADPLDIRDVVDWLEPQLNLDLEKLRVEVRNRIRPLLTGLQGWTIAGGEDGRMNFATRWDNVTHSFHLEFRPEASAVVLTRALRVEPDQNWLLLYVSRNAADNITSQTQAVVKLDGKQAGDFNVNSRWEPDPPPIQIPVDKFHDRQVPLEVRFVSHGGSSYVDFRSMELVDRLPTLFEVFEDEVQRPTTLKGINGNAAVVTADRFSGTACIKVTPKGQDEAFGAIGNLSLPIRESPRFGEYRYLRFAWRKSGGQQIAVDLDVVQSDAIQSHPKNRWQRVDQVRQLARATAELREIEAVIKVRQNDPNHATPDVLAQIKSLEKHLERVRSKQASLQSQIDAAEQELTGAAAAGVHSHVRLFTGQNVSLPIDTRGVKIADSAPGQWTVVSYDLKDLAQGQLTGLSLVCPDGDYAMLDSVYLARTPQDFDHCPPQATPITTK